MKFDLITPEEVGLSSERLARIKPKMGEYVDQKKYSGISTMLARKGRVVHFCQVGWADVESRKPLAPDTIFRIYSMTKPIVCTALMTLYEEGRFQLSDPVAKYISPLGKLRVLQSDAAGRQKQVDPQRAVTVQDLLTHTAGFTYDFWEDSPVSELYLKARICNDAQRSLEEMVHEVARLPLAFQPGSRWHYSVSIDIAAYLAELLSGMPLRDLLAKKIFEPLGMTDTDFAVSPDKQELLATMYGSPDLCAPDMTLSKLAEAQTSGYNQRIDVAGTYPSDARGRFARGGLGLFSTTADYMRFAQLLLDKGQVEGTRMLSRKTCELMHCNHLPLRLLPYESGGAASPGYGFGLGSRVLLDVAQSQLIGSAGEFGWGGAASTYYWVDPQEELVGVMMAQYMVSPHTPQRDFQVLAYQAVVD